VNVHDFRQNAVGRSFPYGIYNLNHNRGYVYVGNSADTPNLSWMPWPRGGSGRPRGFS
jgi:hypothetical protein